MINSVFELLNLKIQISDSDSTLVSVEWAEPTTWNVPFDGNSMENTFYKL